EESEGDPEARGFGVIFGWGFGGSWRRATRLLSGVSSKVEDGGGEVGAVVGNDLSSEKMGRRERGWSGDEGEEGVGGCMLFFRRCGEGREKGLTGGLVRR
ncbi:hypothetical protein HAX54_045498, partial [Datura stramonium]|nr:hypothetical protein [Datura stramonium]